jgi:hypothetical protein
MASFDDDMFYAQTTAFANLDFSSSLDEELYQWQLTLPKQSSENTAHSLLMKRSLKSSASVASIQSGLQAVDLVMSPKDNKRRRKVLQTDRASCSTDESHEQEHVPRSRTGLASTKVLGEAPPFPNDSDQQGIKLNGERRLKIYFEDMGHIGKRPQRFGKSGYFIPDGLRARARMYDQNWKVELVHDIITDRAGREATVVTWTISSVDSGSTVSITESAEEVEVRESCGRTICNVAVREALRRRAEELSESLSTIPPNSPMHLTTINLINALQPKKCSVGLLVFGLLHECVQTRMCQEYHALQFKDN